MQLRRRTEERCPRGNVPPTAATGSHALQECNQEKKKHFITDSTDLTEVRFISYNMLSSIVLDMV